MNETKLCKWKSFAKILIHPISSTQETKEKNQFSILIALFVLLCYFFASIIQEQYTSSNFSWSMPGTLNVLLIFIKTVFVIAVFITANWCVSTLIEGKGKIIEIISSVCYALAPIVAFFIIGTIASYFMSNNEVVFLLWIQWFGIGWSCIIGFMSLMTIHQFSVKKTILLIILTIAGMFIIIFLLLMFISLMQEMVSFGKNIFYEIFFRLS